MRPITVFVNCDCSELKLPGIERQVLRMFAFTDHGVVGLLFDQTIDFTLAVVAAGYQVLVYRPEFEIVLAS